MSHHEKSAWGSLFATLLAWSFLTMRTTENFAFVEVSLRHMIWTYVAVVILMIVAHALVAGVLAAASGGEVRPDERDVAIEARAERIGGLVVQGSINVLIIQALAQAAYPDHALPRVDVGALPVMVYLLLSILFLGHATSQLVTIRSYRA